MDAGQQLCSSGLHKITCMLIISNVFVLFCHQKEISIKFLVKACDGSQLVLMPSSLREVTEKNCYCYFIKSSFTIGSHVDGKESWGWLVTEDRRIAA